MFKSLGLLALVCVCVITSKASAQKYGIVGHSCLSSIDIACGDQAGASLRLKLTYAQDGPSRTIPYAQMYILAFVEKDEAEILKLIRSPLLVDGKQNDQLLEVLKHRKLAVVLDSKATKLVPVDRETLNKDVPFNPASLFRFEFDFGKRWLLEQALVSLPNFSAATSHIEGANEFVHYKDRLKLLVLVPMNNQRYADRIPEAFRDFDMAHYSEFAVLFKQIKVLPYCLEFEELISEESQGSKKERLTKFYVN